MPLTKNSTVRPRAAVSVKGEATIPVHVQISLADTVGNLAGDNPTTKTRREVGNAAQSAVGEDKKGHSIRGKVRDAGERCARDVSIRHKEVGVNIPWAAATG